MSRHPTPPHRRTQVDVETKVVEDAPTIDTTPCALLAVNVSKTYGDAPALNPVSLRVETGDRVALIGHNGSGKTTFLKMSAGLLDPSSGEVSINGNKAGSLGARADVSYISDQPTFYDDLSVWEHLEYVARLHGVDEWEQLAADLLAHLGLYDRADELPNRFSRGLKQKAALAIGFIRPFDVLLVDEPFVGLDAAGKEALLTLLQQASDEGATVIVATHELSFVHTVKRIVALRDGQLVHDGPATGVNVDALVRNEDPAGEHDGEGK
ncbi:MAG: ABC transporter ATP-binding protein [Actinomycetota bacterium]